MDIGWIAILGSVAATFIGARMWAYSEGFGIVVGYVMCCFGIAVAVTGLLGKIT